MWCLRMVWDGCDELITWIIFNNMFPWSIVFMIPAHWFSYCGRKSRDCGFLDNELSSAMLTEALVNALIEN